MPNAQNLSDLMSVGLWMHQHKGVPGTTPYDRYIEGLPPPGYVWTGDHWENPPATAPKLTQFYSDPYGGFGQTWQTPTRGTVSYGRVVQPYEKFRMDLEQAALGGNQEAAGILSPWQQFQLGFSTVDPSKGLPHERDLSQPSPTRIASTPMPSGAVQNLMNISNQQLWGGTASLPKGTSTATPKATSIFGTAPNAFNSLMQPQTGGMDLWDYRKPFGAR